MCFGLGLGVRDPATSLFHDEKFEFFEFGVSDTPKLLEFFLGVLPTILKKVDIFSSAAKRRLQPGATVAGLRRPWLKPMIFKSVG